LFRSTSSSTTSIVAMIRRPFPSISRRYAGEKNSHLWVSA
jgi:hypothetical protein